MQKRPILVLGAFRLSALLLLTIAAVVTITAAAAVAAAALGAAGVICVLYGKEYNSSFFVVATFSLCLTHRLDPFSLSILLLLPF